MSNLGISKLFAMSFFNLLLANIIIKNLLNWKVSKIIIITILFTNFYLFVLYFAAERLKFGFIFFFYAVYYSKSIFKRNTFILISVISHIQIGIIYFSDVFANYLSFNYTPANLNRSNNKLSFLFYIILIFCSIVYFKDQIFSKFITYSENSTDNNLFQNTWQVLFFMFSSLMYSNEKLKTFFTFLILSILASLIGPERIVMIAYFFFMYYALKYKNGYNFPILASMLYFAIKSIYFVINIIKFGNGFE